MQQVKIKIQAFGAIERQLPQDLEILCDVNSHVSAVLDQIGCGYPSTIDMIERCACAIGEDIISRQTRIHADLTLVLLSPVAGG